VSNHSAENFQTHSEREYKYTKLSTISDKMMCCVPVTKSADFIAKTNSRRGIVPVYQEQGRQSGAQRDDSLSPDGSRADGLYAGRDNQIAADYTKLVAADDAG